MTQPEKEQALKELKSRVYDLQVLVESFKSEARELVGQIEALQSAEVEPPVQ